jgi:hypothetical protein
MLINLAEKRRTPNVARKTSNQNRVPAIPDNNNRLTAPLDVERWTLSVGRFLYRCFSSVSSRTQNNSSVSAGVLTIWPSALRKPSAERGA